MSEVRPVASEPPIQSQAVINPKTGCLTTYGHHILRTLWERSGGFDDDVWVSLGLGFQAVANQGRTDGRLTSLEGTSLALAAAVGGIRGDPRLQTADRAEAGAKDALVVALSRAPADLVRRVEALERSVQVTTGALGEVRAQTQMAFRQSRAEIADSVTRAGFESGLQAYVAKQERDRTNAIAARLDGLEGDFATNVWAALGGTDPVLFNDTSGEISLNASLTSLGTTLTAADLGYYTTAEDTWAGYDLSAFGRDVAGLTDAAAGRTLFGLGDLATASTVNNGDWSGADLEIANGGTGASTASAARTALGLAIGSDVLAYVAPSPGWSAATGTATRTAFNTATVTLSDLAERVKAMIDDNLTSNRFGP